VKKAKAKRQAVEAAPKKTRKRQSNVRGLILGLLESGPLSSPSLVAQGGFSPASLYLNIKAMKKEGLISAKRNGREVFFSLTGKSAGSTEAVSIPERKKAAAKTTKVKPAVTPSAIVAYVPAELHEALNGLTLRLTPVEHVEEKMLVLDQLSASLPPAIGSILSSIREDLARLVAAPGR